MLLNCGDKKLDLSLPKLMGVLNVTPDSFSDGGQFAQIDEALVHAEQMLTEGADIIDIGGESTRPGADPVSEQQELDRVIPVVEALKARFDTVVSVDTSTALVMQEAASKGAGLINDVRALQREGAIEAAAQSGLPVCLMHMQGNPETMQQRPTYNNVVEEVSAFLQQRIDAAMNAGIEKARLLVDPGFGFGKTPEHNYQLLKHLRQFLQFDLPLLVGMSRKSMIGAVLQNDVSERLIGSVVLAMMAANSGAHIIRVHDVKETQEAMTLLQAINKPEMFFSEK